MNSTVLKIAPHDDVFVALTDLHAGQQITGYGETIVIREPIPQKHKFAARDLSPDESIRMYGAVVGRAVAPIARGHLLTSKNIVHRASPFQLSRTEYKWTPPDCRRFQGRTFDGYQRADGRVGTRNYWLVVPLVFCENRNLMVMREAMLQELGFGQADTYRLQVRQLISLYQADANRKQLLACQPDDRQTSSRRERVFPHVDGIKFLLHESGCGSTPQDARSLCGLLAGYITHPNVAGATVMSLGCQNAQIELLRCEIDRRDPAFGKPLFVFEQQQYQSEQTFLADAIKHTFTGLIEAEKCRRQPASPDKLVTGVECGGSDGFSGISANPAIGHASDLLVALGGAVILSEFPELSGVEQHLIDRCVSAQIAERFIGLQRSYEKKLQMIGSGFRFNPSAGNLREGLITDAMKSAGAARKGGTSPITGVLDYPEWVTQAGLNLLCTPGNDVESTTAMAGAGANLIVFSTGLGTPTGNPITPVIKVSSNTELFRRMPDLIDLNAGEIISGNRTVQEIGEAIFEFCLAVASGQETCATKLGQDDFIPWKRGLSL